MSAMIEKYLYDIDQSFAQKTDKDIKMIYAMVFFILVMFSYLLFWDSAEAEYNSAKEASTAVQAKITADKKYLVMNPESKIVKLNQDISTFTSNLESYKQENIFVKEEIEKIPELFYDEQIWGEFIDSVAENARKNDVKLNFFANRLAADKTKFGHVLNLEIKSEGKYKNLIRFVNSIEKSRLVVDIHDLNFSAKTDLRLDFNLSVWGITY